MTWKNALGAGIVAGAVSGTVVFALMGVAPHDRGAAGQILATLVGLLGAGFIANWQTRKQLDSVADQIEASSSNAQEANRTQMAAVGLQVTAAAELAVASRHYADRLDAALGITDALGAVANDLAGLSTEWMHQLGNQTDAERQKLGAGSWFDEARWNADTERLRRRCMEVLIAFERWRMVGGEDTVYALGPDIERAAWDAADASLDAVHDLSTKSYAHLSTLELMNQLSLRTKAAGGKYADARTSVDEEVRATIALVRHDLDALQLKIPNA